MMVILGYGCYLVGSLLLSLGTIFMLINHFRGIYG